MSKPKVERKISQSNLKKQEIAANSSSLNFNNRKKASNFYGTMVAGSKQGCQKKYK